MDDRFARRMSQGSGVSGLARSNHIRRCANSTPPWQPQPRCRDIDSRHTHRRGNLSGSSWCSQCKVCLGATYGTVSLEHMCLPYLLLLSYKPLPQFPSILITLGLHQALPLFTLPLPVSCLCSRIISFSVRFSFLLTSVCFPAPLALYLDLPPTH